MTQVCIVDSAQTLDDDLLADLLNVALRLLVQCNLATIDDLRLLAELNRDQHRKAA